MRTLSGRIQGLEQVGGFGGKAVALAEGMLYADDPDFYRTRLAQLARVTPAAGARGDAALADPAGLALRVDPGEREAYDEAPGVTGARAGAQGSGPAVRPRYYRPPQPGEQPLAPRPYAPRPMPEIAGAPTLDFPDVERARLSNGIQVIYARRNVVPVTRIDRRVRRRHRRRPGRPARHPGD